MWVAEFFHVLVGILWIGLLYFFNLVQVQSMPKMTEAGAAKPYTQIILPKALFLFRHAALWTVITGIIYYVVGRNQVQGIPSREIMIGMVLGIIMAFNVWVLIWPNQKKNHRRRIGRRRVGQSQTNRFSRQPNQRMALASHVGLYGGGKSWRFRILIRIFRV